MTDSTYILAHDLGTTGNKVTLVDAESGMPAASTLMAYSTRYPLPNWAEQDAADWRTAVFGGTRRLLARSGISPGQIAAISFSGTMNGALSVDRSGQHLRPAIIWADQRATEEAQLLAQAFGLESIYHRTGHRPGAAYTAAKMMWIKRHQPEVYNKTHVFLQSKDYAAYLLSGEFATDYSDASGTNLFDLERRVWAADIVESAGLDLDKLPQPFPSATVIGRVTRDAASFTGLLAGTPVVIGGGDGACATVGAGAVTPGDSYTNIGSSSWIAVTTEEPWFDPKMRTFSFVHMDPRYYFPCGAMQAAGGSFDWLERLLRDSTEDRQHAQLSALAAGIRPGANGLIFLPYLLGERSPHWNTMARGAFVGLTMTHGRPEIVRAVLEGVGLNLRMILEAFQAQGTKITAMRLIGGGARSTTWRQILADIYGLPIQLPRLVAEATSLGAAVAGGVGVGLYPDFGVAKKLVQVENAEEPNPSNTGAYETLYGLFQRTYSALEPIFPGLAEI